MWCGRVTDVSELSSGTLNGAEAEAGEMGKGLREWGRDEGVGGWREGLEGYRDSAEPSLLFLGMLMWLAKRIDAESTSCVFLSSLQTQRAAEAPREPRTVRKL